MHRNFVGKASISVIVGSFYRGIYSGTPKRWTICRQIAAMVLPANELITRMPTVVDGFFLSMDLGKF